MQTQTLKQKAPVLGAIMLIIYALITGFSSIIKSIGIIINTVSVLTNIDYYSGESYTSLLFSNIRLAISEILSNPLGLVPLVCIVIAILALAKKKGIFLLIASALMTVFSLGGVLGNISSTLLYYVETFSNLVDHGSIVELLDFWALDRLILSPVMSIAASLSVALMWLFFTLLILACADGKLGFLKKVKKLVGALFTISVILMLICTLGSAARAITMDNILYPLWLILQFGEQMHLNVAAYIMNVFSITVSAVATIIFAVGLSSIGAWVKAPAVIEVTAEESAEAIEVEPAE